jgi:hypothetical protein
MNARAVSGSPHPVGAAIAASAAAHLSRFVIRIIPALLIVSRSSYFTKIIVPL